MTWRFLSHAPVPEPQQAGEVLLVKYSEQPHPVTYVSRKAGRNWWGQATVTDASSLTRETLSYDPLARWLLCPSVSSESIMPLVSIVGNDLLVRCTAEAVKHLAELNQSDFGEEYYRITNTIGFARDVVKELEEEQEDGTTLVHEMLDTAIEGAVEKGSEHIEWLKGDADQ